MIRSQARAAVRAVRLGTAVAIAALGIGCAWDVPAHASPDRDKIVATLDHVDSPHAFFENDNFVLRGHFGSSPFPAIDDTVIWVGKGWGDRGVSNYTLRVPEGADSAFLGKPGQALYRSPAVPGFTYSPNWVGMGADAGVPIEKFRSQEFSLDLVDVKGPGHLEMFNFRAPLPPYRLLSDTDPNFRSYWMTRGTHTHNETTFTKPGRYELTYRVSARGVDGSLIQSQPQTLVWQVGGPNPKASSIKDIRQAYTQAPSATSASTPTLTLRSHDPQSTGNRDADDLLTDLEVTTGNAEDKGTVTFLIDGYYLAEVPLENGKATWTEMLGDETASLQAVYIPSSGPTGKWASKPVAFTRAGSALAPNAPSLVTVTESAAEISEPAPVERPAFPAAAGQVGSSPLIITGEPVEPGSSTIRFHAHSDDHSLFAHVTGGIYVKGEDIPSCAVEFAVAKGEGEDVVDTSYCADDGNYELRLNATPHPLLTGGAAHDTLPQWHYTKPTQQTLTFVADDGGSHEVDPAKPSPGERHECTREKPCVFSSGHTDIFHVHVGENKTLALDLKEDITGSEVIREPETVVLHVRKQALVNDVAKLPEVGEAAYVLPPVQDQRLLWPGWDTLGVREAGWKHVGIVLDEISGPGRVCAFLPGNLGGKLQPITRSQRMCLESGDEINVATPSHAHLTWAFTRPGTYTMKAHARVLDEGVDAVSAPVTYTWRVGEVEADSAEVKPPAKPDQGDPHAGQPEIEKPGHTPSPAAGIGLVPMAFGSPVARSEAREDDPATTSPTAASTDSSAQDTGEAANTGGSQGSTPAVSTSPAGLARTGLSGPLSAWAVFAAGLACAGVGLRALARQLMAA